MYDKASLFTMLIICLANLSSYAQEYIYGSGTEMVTYLGSPIEVGDSVYFAINTQTSPDHAKGSHQDHVSYFMSFDQDGVLQSSTLHPDTNKVAADSVHLNKMGGGINPDIAFLGYRGAGANPSAQPKVKTFAVYDIPSRTVLQQVPLDTIGTHHIVISFDQDSAHLILGGGLIDSFPQGYRAFYSVYDNNYNLLKTQTQKSSVLNGVQAMGGKYYIFHRSPEILFEVLNNDLSRDTLLMRPDSYPFPAYYNLFRFDYKVIPNAHGRGFYSLAAYLNNNYAVVKFNEDYSIARVDSFPIYDSVYGKAGSFKQAFDYNTPDTIYGIAGFWRTTSTWDGMDDPGRTEPLKVVQFDTTGSLHWSRLIVRDSAVYFPYRLLATQDGGVLVFSFLYDTRYSTQIHSRLSVIKIGADGSVLHENEYDLPRPKELELYPNPVSSKLHLRLEQKNPQAPGHYRIFSAEGGTQLGGTYRPNTPINVERLAPGSYFLHLMLDNGMVRAGRFVKGK